MSGSGAEEDLISPRTLDDTESPRKRMRLENSGRKGWSLMDRRTDQEVLQEMGVSLLEPDDSDTVCDAVAVLPHKSGVKRRHDQENMNPNVNSVTSPRGKSRSPFKPCSPSPGPSRVRSPRSADKSRPLRPTDPSSSETALHSDYLTNEETPLAQLNSARYWASSARSDNSGHVTPATTATTTSIEGPGLEEELVLTRRALSEPCGSDSFSALSDEMLLSVFRWLPKRTLAHCMLVCKRWHRVACDETLWQRLDLGNKTLASNALGRVLARKPVIVRLANSEIGPWHPSGPLAPSRVLYLDLSTCSADRRTLDALLASCPQLRKLSLESVALEDSTCRIIGQCSQLETLNLSMARGVSAAGLQHVVDGCAKPGKSKETDPKKQKAAGHKSQTVTEEKKQKTNKNKFYRQLKFEESSLNVSWMALSAEALQRLVSALPPRTLRLNLAGARNLTDHMVSSLVARCPRLLELDLSDCSQLTVAALSDVTTLSRLEHLALSRCYLLPPLLLHKLGSMPSLQYVEVWGMLQAASLAALRASLPALQLNQFMFSAIARPTVGTRRTSIWGLRTRD